METIRGTYSRFLAKPGSQAGESGLALIRYESSGQVVDAKLSGPFSPMAQPDEWFVAFGEWKSNTYRGKNELIFRARSVQPDLPATKAGVLQMLTRTFTPDFHGVGRDRIEAFVSKHGERAALKAESDPKILLELSADPVRFGAAILRDWSRRISARAPIRIMEQAGVVDKAVKAVLRVHRDASLGVIERNPYELARIPAVGFLEADKIGSAIGVARDDPRRVGAAVSAAAAEEDSAGHTYIPFSAMKPSLEKNGVDAESLKTLVASGGDGSLIFDREDGMPLAQRRHLHDCERLVAVRVARLLENGRTMERTPIDRVSDEILSSAKFTHFDPIQQQAVRTSARESVSILTGGPGTGKSTVTEAIAEIAARTATGPVILMAPTGKAARRLEETTGRSASTVHKALGATGEGGLRFTHNRANPLPKGCFVVVDEASMLDTEVTAALLDSLPDDGRILFVGDRNQLPSVGPGYVLGDMIAARSANGARVPCSELLNVYRNAKGSMIAHYAAQIRDGSFEAARLDNVMRGGVMMYDMKGSAITERVVHLMSKLIPKSLKLDAMKDVAVLCPQRRGTAGTYELNAALSRALNPRGRAIDGLAHGPDDDPKAPLPRVGDRVMLTRNDYENDVMNGDIGTIADAFLDDSGPRKERKVRVEFDAGQRVDFPISRCRDLTLAYAITGHKSQGSQYPCVIMPVSGDHAAMLDRTLVYTEWTRAKDFLILVGEPETFSKSLDEVSASSRRTRLKRFLEHTLSAAPVPAEASVSPGDVQGFAPPAAPAPRPRGLPPRAALAPARPVAVPGSPGRPVPPPPRVTLPRTPPLVPRDEDRAAMPVPR